MEYHYWNDLYSGWGWFLWFGFMLLFFSSVGNWGYTYSAHRKNTYEPRKEALDILASRFARGEIYGPEYNRMKSEIKEESQGKILSDGLTGRKSTV